MLGLIVKVSTFDDIVSIKRSAHFPLDFKYSADHSLILVVNDVGELQRKRTLAASRGFLAAARLSCCFIRVMLCISAI